MNTINNDIFHNWKPREVAAMNRATAWLRAMQSEEWQFERHRIIQAAESRQHPERKPKPMKGIV